MKTVIAATVLMAPSNGAEAREKLIAMLLEGWHRLAHKITDPYRPEKHYMRGPGPAWHAKNNLKFGIKG